MSAPSGNAVSENKIRSRWNPHGKVPNGGCQEVFRHGLVQTISGDGKAVQVVCVSRETTSTTFELMDVSPAGKSYSGPEEWPRYNGSAGNDTKGPMIHAGRQSWQFPGTVKKGKYINSLGSSPSST